MTKLFDPVNSIFVSCFTLLLNDTFHIDLHQKKMCSVSADSVSICFSSQKCHFVMDLNLKKGLRLVIHADRSADTQNTFIVLEFTKNRFEEELNKERMSKLFFSFQRKICGKKFISPQLV